MALWGCVKCDFLAMRHAENDWPFSIRPLNTPMTSSCQHVVNGLCLTSDRVKFDSHSKLSGPLICYAFSRSVGVRAHKKSWNPPLLYTERFSIPLRWQNFVRWEQKGLQIWPPSFEVSRHLLLSCGKKYVRRAILWKMCLGYYHNLG